MMKYTPNIERVNLLRPGVKIESYKKMCELLGQKKETSCSKKAQIAEWKRHFKFRVEKRGTKNCFIIEEIYSVPLFKVDERTEKKGIYIDWIKPLTCQMVLSSKTGVCDVTSNILFERLGMVNRAFGEEYVVYRNRRSNGTSSNGEIFDVDDIIRDAFFATSKNFCSEKLKTALDSLQKNRQLVVSEEYWITEIEYVEEINGVRKKMYSEKRKANASEKERIYALTKEALEGTGYVSWGEAYLSGPGKMKEIYRSLRKNQAVAFGYEDIEITKFYRLEKTDNTVGISGEEVEKMKSILNERINYGIEKKLLSNLRRNGKWKKQMGNIDIPELTESLRSLMVRFIDLRPAM